MAEVLITLGIIGIVAALTIPALTANYQKREVPIRLKKMYNTLWNAIELAEIENGPSANWTFSNADESKEFYMTQIRARMKCVNYKNFHKTVTYHPDAACFFSDGSAILLSVFTQYGLLTVHFYPFYSEKAKRYNNSASTSRRYYFPYSIVLTPYSFHTFNHQYFGKTKVEVTQVNVPVNGLTRDQLLNGPVFGNEINGFCNGTGTGCFHVIKRDGWKIAPDYPW